MVYLIAARSRFSLAGRRDRAAGTLTRKRSVCPILPDHSHCQMARRGLGGQSVLSEAPSLGEEKDVNRAQVLMVLPGERTRRRVARRVVPWVTAVFAWSFTVGPAVVGWANEAPRPPI